MQADRKPSSSGGEDGDGASLGSPHDGTDVVLAKDPLNGHRIGTEGVQDCLELNLEATKALRQRGVWRSSNDADID
jgi:hypothetical protein